MLNRFREAEAERLRSEQRSRELAEARKREEMAQQMAARAVKTQEEARRQRLSEMQKVDLAKSFAPKNDILSRSSSEDLSIPAMKPVQAKPILDRLSPPAVKPATDGLSSSDLDKIVVPKAQCKEQNPGFNSFRLFGKWNATEDSLYSKQHRSMLLGACLA